MTESSDSIFTRFLQPRQVLGSVGVATPTDVYSVSEGFTAEEDVVSFPAGLLDLLANVDDPKATGLDYYC